MDQSRLHYAVFGQVRNATGLPILDTIAAQATADCFARILTLPWGQQPTVRFGVLWVAITGRVWDQVWGGTQDQILAAVKEDE